MLNSSATLQDQFTLMLFAHRHALDMIEEAQRNVYRNNVTQAALDIWGASIRQNVWRANLARSEGIRINAQLPKGQRRDSGTIDALMPYYDADKCVAAIKKLGDACEWPHN